MTIHDIAKAAGVSVATVSRIINHKDENISPETRARVLKIIEENHYVPYSRVRTQLLEDNKMVGFILPSLASPFYTSIVERLQKLFSQQGCTLSLFFSHNDPELEKQAISHFTEIHAMGIVYCPGSLEGIDFFKKKQSNISNAVLLDCLDTKILHPQIYRDYYQMVKKETTFLLEKGHQHPSIIISKDAGFWKKEEILKGYKDALSSNGILPNENMMIYVDNTIGNQIDSLMNIGIDSIICQAPYLVGEVYRLAALKHFLIPQDLSVLCLEDSEIMCHFTPQTDSLQSNVEETAQNIFRALLPQDKLRKSISTLWQIPYTLLKRQSTAFRKKTRAKIIIAGSINMDITLKIPRFPHPGETLLASDLYYWPGGKGANQAIGVSRFGVDAYMFGCLGNDLYGKQLHEHLLKENVNMTGVSFVNTQPTGTAYINIQSNGNSTIVVNPGANTSLTPSYIQNNHEFFNDIDYCLIQMEIPFDSVQMIIEICKKKAIKVILKPVPAKSLSPSLLKGLYMLVPNQKEAALLCPDQKTPEEQAEALLAQGVEHVIITLGEKGCIYASKDEIISFPAYPYPCVDSTGASDVFISCLAAQLVNGKEMNKAIEMSILAASFSISKVGVQNAILDQELLNDLYDKKISSFYTSEKKQ